MSNSIFHVGDVTELGSLAQALTRDVVNLADYQGVDPQVFRQKVNEMELNQTNMILFFSYTAFGSTNFSGKHKDRRMTEMKNAIDYLASKGVNMEGKQGVNDTQTLTPNRLVAAFPDVTATLLAKFPDKIKAKFPFSSDSLPEYLRFPNAGPLLMSDDEFDQWKLWTAKFDDLTGNTLPKKTDYATIQYTSSMFSPEERANIRSSLEQMYASAKATKKQ